jgi:hypothetical protein
VVESGGESDLAEKPLRTEGVRESLLRTFRAISRSCLLSCAEVHDGGGAVTELSLDLVALSEKAG